MIRDVETYFLLFLIYSFLGWFMESVGGILNVKKFVNRGFLIGPYCPIYGVGVICLTILLKKYKDDIIALFFLSMIVCAVLEYFTSYIMEKIFNARWWNYGNKKFNINGRICLETTIPFGLCGCLFLLVLNPFFIKYINLIPDLALHILCSIIAIGMFIDFIISSSIIINFKVETKEVKDNTDEISSRVKDVTDEISEKIKLDTRNLVRNIRLNTNKLKPNLKYTGKIKILSTSDVKEIMIKKKQQLEERIQSNKMLLQLKLETLKQYRTAKIKERFEKKSRFHQRLLKAFPNFEIGKK